LRNDVLGTEVVLRGADPELCDALARKGFDVVRRPDVILIEVEGEARVGEVLADAIAAGAHVVEVSRRRETLEDLFMRRSR
jgi:ABC-2 type transport system ATP-binding protein